MENQPRFEKFTLNIIFTSNINMISYHHTAFYLTVTLHRLKTMDTKIIPSMVLCHVERKIRPNYWLSHDIIRIQIKDLLYLSS